MKEIKYGKGNDSHCIDVNETGINWLKIINNAISKGMSFNEFKNLFKDENGYKIGNTDFTKEGLEGLYYSFKTKNNDK